MDNDKTVLINAMTMDTGLDRSYKKSVGWSEQHFFSLTKTDSVASIVARTRGLIDLGMTAFRVAWRMSNISVHILIGLGLMLLMGFRNSHSGQAQKSVVRWWFGRLCRILNVRIDVIGKPSEKPQFVVCNHISWLDIPVLGSLKAQRFLAKSEVKSWPLVGAMASWAGTLFIRRGAGESRNVANTIGKKIYDGESVLVFPEGTSTDGRQVKRYFPNLFKAAHIAGCSVQPIAIVYKNDPAINQSIAFIGDDEFHHHLVRFVKLKSICVQVYFLPELDPSAEQDRTTPGTLAEMCWRSTNELVCAMNHSGLKQ